ncbi:MAG TPA: carboxypeptidase-like regulatory domain-containing protein, partial [Thermoanaerobaculia bacterium]|nr:carboxypeptidase-like regulatory domain-containing protein [Thermoanaerobaculia bacterium]
VNISIVPSPTGNYATSGMPRSTVSDDNGEYMLEGLEAGEETISFSHPKHSSARKNVALKGRETRLDVQLAAGQKLTGVVVTESGTPVADATVEAMGAGFQSVRSDASGTFTFDALPAGRYRLSATKTGYAEGVLDDYDASSGAQARIVLKTGGTIYGRVTGLSPQELANVEVTARGGRSSASAAVDPQGNFRIDGTPTGVVQVSAAMTRMASGYRSSSSQTVEVAPGGSQQVEIVFRGDVIVKGRITRNGTPLAGASVMFAPKSSQRQAAASASADEQGVYSVSGLEEGEYNVIVSDMQRTFSPYQTTYRVTGSGTFDIDYKTGMVRGRVTDSGTGEAVANASVQLRPPGGADSFRTMRGGITDSTGAFVIDSVPPGSYTITASKDGYGNQVQDLYVSDSGVDGLELRMARNDGVALRVFDARDGRAISAMVVVYDLQGRVVHETRYMFGGAADAADMKLPLGPGQYTASVQASGYAPRNVSFYAPSQQSVALTPGGTLHVQSTRSTPARVRLIDANGLPYPRFGWTLQGRELLPSPAVTTYQNVAPGTYTLQLLGENEVVLDSKQITIAEGQATTTDM